MRRRPFFRSPTTAVVIGGALFLAGAWCLHDAYEKRGREQPALLRPFSFW